MHREIRRQPIGVLATIAWRSWVHHVPFMRLSFLVLAIFSLVGCGNPEQARLTSARIPTQAEHLAAVRAAAPAAMRAQFQTIGEAFNGQVGIAVMDLRDGWTASYQGARVFPQQSVAKLWVAMAVLDQVDQGRLSLDQRVRFQRSDLSLFSQPIARLVTARGYETDVRDLIRRALVQSDNAADDRLIEIAGGIEAVEQAIDRRGLTTISVGEDQRQLQTRIAGLDWRPEYAGNSRLFRADRTRLPPAQRQASLEAYLNAPPDGATPDETVAALARLQRGVLLSPSSTALMLQDMTASRTGPRRLRGALPPGWTLAHKTGTGPDLRDETVGVNDVGLLTAPDGHVFAVAVFIARTRAPIPERLAMMQSVAQVVIDHWLTLNPQYVPPPPIPTAGLSATEAEGHE